jgi:hypothetical protein
VNRWLLLAALLLPALWLGAGIATQERALGRSSEWRIPIQGYDPRDPIRGQYVRFTYAWAFAGDRTLCDSPVGCHLCLSQTGATVTATANYPSSTCRNKVDPRLSQMDVRPGFSQGEPPLFLGRLFVSEASAPELEAQLREGPMVVVAALSPEGRLINRRIEPSAPRTQP